MNFDFRYLPKLGGGFEGKGYAFLALTHAMFAGEIKGLFCFGQNPAVGGANARLIRAALDKLDWLVVADLFEHETASFWKRPGTDPAEFLPKFSFYRLLPASRKRAASSIAGAGRSGATRRSSPSQLPPRPRYRRRPRQGRQARLREGRSISRADPPPRLGLWRARGSASCRARVQWALRSQCD